MANRRLELHAIFKSICSNVYFQPPESVKMKYPAIRYSRAAPFTNRADNSLYKKKDAYTIVYIDKNPDSEVPDILLGLPYCSQNSSPYVSDNLYHYIFNIYY